MSVIARTVRTNKDLELKGYRGGLRIPKSFMEKRHLTIQDIAEELTRHKRMSNDVQFYTYFHTATDMHILTWRPSSQGSPTA